MVALAPVLSDRPLDPPFDDIFDRTVTGLAREFAINAARHDAAGTFPVENIARLHQAGLIAGTVPAQWGGTGAGLERALRAVNGVARGEASTALVLALQYLFHRPSAGQPGPGGIPPIRERIAQSAVRDGALGNVLRVEPELGTPVRGGLPATVARRVGDGWRISGRKIYSTGAPALAWFAVWARSDDAVPLVGTWVVPRGTPGLSVVETWNHLGMRASASHDVLFDDVWVPFGHALDIRPADGWAAPDPVAAAWGMTLFGAVYDGVARAARDWFVDFLRRRAPSNLGATLATLPRMQEAVGGIDALLHVNRVMLKAAATATDRGTPPSPTESALLKLTVTTNAIAAVEKAVALSGNPGISCDNALQRHYRDVLCARIHSPQADTILINAGRAALG